MLLRDAEGDQRGEARGGMVRDGLVRGLENSVPRRGIEEFLRGASRSLLDANLASYLGGQATPSTPSLPVREDADMAT